MKLTDEENALIQDYLNDNLTEETRLRFGATMKNKDFKNEVVRQLAVLSALQDSQNQKLKEKILAFDSEEKAPEKEAEQKTNTKVFRINNYLKYAAVLVLMFAAVMVFRWMSDGGSMTNDALYASAYETYPAQEVKRGKEEEVFEGLKSAMDSYRKNDFAAALSGFEALEVDDANIDLYKGVCSMELNQMDKARGYFSQVLESGEASSKDVAEWYTVLVDLKSQNKPQFEKGLASILSDSSHLFYQKATELKSKMK